jgi:hypothetical protein
VNTGGQTVMPVSAVTNAPISPTGYTDRTVDLTATIDGKQYVYARVRFVDGNGDNPGYRVKILEWSASK